MAAKVPEDKIEENSNRMGIDNLLDGMKSLNLDSDVHEHDKNIPLWLQNFESPFHWHTQLPRAHPTGFMIERCLEKLEELNLDEQHFSLRRYTVLLKLLLEYSVEENKEKVQETMETIKKSIIISETDPQYERFKIILAHVISTTEAHLLALDEQEVQSKKIAQNIVPIHQMSNSNKAGLRAMKANFFLYSGYQNSESVAVKLAREALVIEPDSHEWSYLLAKVLRQQRKDVPFNGDVPREELVLLEDAVKKCNNSKYLHYLAQIYRECAVQAHKQHRFQPNYFSSDLYKTIQAMQRKSLSYYKEALELEPNHAGNLRRIGYGIMNLPENLADYDLALDCLMKSLGLCYNLNTLHIIGTFYHRYKSDNKTALEYFEKTANAGCHAGLSDMIRLKYLENPEYDPCEDIEKGLQKEIKTKNRVFLLAQRNGYFLFIKRDFLKSIDSFNQAISEDKDSLHLTVFKSLFLRMFDPISLYHYVANEALLYLQQNKSSSEEQDNEDNVYEVMALIDTITNIHPELGEIDPDPFLIDKLCESSKKISDKEKFKNNKMRFQEPKCNFQSGWQGGFQPWGRRGSSGRGGATESHDNKRGRPFSGNQRNNKEPSDSAIEEKTERFSASSNERGRYHKTRGQKGLRSDDEMNWRRK